MKRIPIMCAVVLLGGCGTAALSPSTSAVVTSVSPTAAPTTVSTLATTSVPPSTSQSAPSSTVDPLHQPTVPVYLVANGVLHVVGRPLASSDPFEVVRALLAGPATVELGAGVTTALPGDAQVHSVVVRNGTATVDLSANVATGAPSDLGLRAAQVVYTLTALPGIAAVEFAFDGVVNYGFGRPELNVHPLGRAQFTDGVLPPILLESPMPYAAIGAQGVVVSGVASTFEATVNYRVLNATGITVAEGMTMATCGSGCWGTFEVQVALPSGDAGPFTVQVFDYSEKDGTVVDLQQVVVVR